jgi:hypothetical protein
MGPALLPQNRRELHKKSGTGPPGLSSQGIPRHTSFHPDPQQWMCIHGDVHKTRPFAELPAYSYASASMGSFRAAIQAG